MVYLTDYVQAREPQCSSNENSAEATGSQATHNAQVVDKIYNTAEKVQCGNEESATR